MISIFLFPSILNLLRNCLKIVGIPVAVAAFIAMAQQASASPVKIFIMAGQSNMQGQGEIGPVSTQGTLQYITANDPEGKYQFLKNGAAWAVRNDVWMDYERSPGSSVRTGGLTPGFGVSDTTIGPELGFGNVVGDALENQVLLIKCSWGGKSLGFDFCPPSSRIGAPAPVADGDLGFYYKETLRLVNQATSNLATYVPGYVPADGYEIAGFAWHQGYNDRVTPAFSAAYEVNMANFITDIRTDLGVPGLPFVIATTGMDGSQGHGYTQVEKAQLKMADTTAYPAFAGNVTVIDTRATYDGLNFWQPVSASYTDQGYHWNRNAKTYVNIGLAMGDAMNLIAPGRTPYRLRASGGTGGTSLTWKNGTQIPTSVRVLRNGVEIAASAPANPTVFVDSTAPLGTLQYELQFTMTGAPAAPLTITHSSGVTDLAASDRFNGMQLSWKNNLAYTGIEVRRGGTLLTTLSGNATAYIDPVPPAGSNIYTVTPSDPGSTPAQVAVNVSGAARGTAIIYEPFDMPVGAQLPGQPAGIGIDNLWTGDTNVTVTSGSLTFGALPVFGNRTTRTTGNASCDLFLGDVLQNAGLISPGSELWFSFLAPNPNNTGISTALVIGNESLFNSTTTIANSGSAIGVRLNQGTQVQAMIYKNGTSVATSATQATLAASETALVVGHIQWGATPGATSTISVYTPSSTDFLLDTPQSVSAVLDPSNFRVLSIWGNTTAPALDEIRFGATYGDVIGAAADTSADFTPPTPGVMSFAVAPAAISETAITMTATTASDANGAQYRFHNATLDTYSLWQGSTIFTDNGLTPGNAYTYTVQARDISVNQNTNTASPGTPASTSPPDINPPPVPGFASSPSALSTTAITMTATTVTDPEGASVEYRFNNTTLGTNSGWQSGTAYIATGLSPTTTYAFTVQARDTAFYQNTSAQSAPLSATTDAITTRNGTWNANSGGVWSDATKWQSNLVANGAGFTANFNMTTSGDRIIAVDSARTIGNLTRTWPANGILTIGGTSVLTLEVPSGSPTITNNDLTPARSMGISAPIIGIQGLAIAGGGMVQISNSTSTFNGPTAVTDGSFLDFGGLATAKIGGGTGRNITLGAGSTLRFDTLSNAVLNRIVETSNVITVMTATTSNNLNFSSSTGANLPNAFLSNWASNGAKCEYNGIITPASDAYRLGTANGSGLLGIRSLLSGTQGLIVGGRVDLVASNTFSGDTTIPTGAKLVVGNNLALQNSALDVGSAGGTFALAAGNAGGTITGEIAATSPTFGGLKGSRNLSAAFTASSGGNNEGNLAATAVTGFTLNVGSSKSCTYSGVIANFAVGTTVTKTGPGTQILAGANSYTGATNVNQGKWFINGNSSTATGNVSIAGGATIGGTGTIGGNISIAATGKLEFDLSNVAANHDKLDLATGKLLVFSGASVLTLTSSGGAAPGLYTLVTAPGAASITGAAPATVILPSNWTANAPIIVADGPNTSLKINITSTGASPYNTWKAGPFQGTLNDPSASLDFDNGGLETGIEWVVGGDPTKGSDDSGLAPTFDNSDPDHFIFTYRRSDTANADPNTSITVQYSSSIDTNSWTTASNGVNGVTIDASAVPAAGFHTVVVSLPKSLSSGGKLFIHLRVVVSP